MLRRASGPLGALLLAACGSGTVRIVDGTWSSPPAGRLELRELGVEVPEAREEAPAIMERLREELADRLSGPEPVLVLEPRVVEFRAEYGESKVWGGGGDFVRGTVTLEVVFKDAKGARLAAIRSTGVSKSGGWAVGSMAAAGRRAVKGLADFVEDSFPRGAAGGVGDP